MAGSMDAELPSPHAGSGTGWQPASVPARLWMTSRDGWDLMAHGVVFATYNQQGGPRGEGKAESVQLCHVDGTAQAGTRERFCFVRCFPRSR